MCTRKVFAVCTARGVAEGQRDVAARKRRCPQPRRGM
jgi:hypothetical protein